MPTIIGFTSQPTREKPGPTDRVEKIVDGILKPRRLLKLLLTFCRARSRVVIFNLAEQAPLSQLGKNRAGWDGVEKLWMALPNRSDF